VAAVQVMTIHKAKGLGFDVVILPEIPDEGIPQSQYFEVAEGRGWLTQTPPKWARAMIPQMREAEAQWVCNQRYETFCMLYVALTRAKRGLHILLEPPSKSSDPNKPSLANFMARALGAEGRTGVVYQTGVPQWPENVAVLPQEKKPEAPAKPGEPIPRRSRMTPSGEKRKEGKPAHSPSGMKFGTQVHALLEGISWIDETPPQLPPGEAATVVAGLLHNPALAGIFERRGRDVGLYREQATDAILDGKQLTGVIDRLHIHRNVEGMVKRVEIIDFKTDAVKEPGELIAKYSAQMAAYRAALEMIHPDAEVQCVLLSVRHGQLVFL
jgi:ATP-dependent exoDNAse (exonuclease V) beta subunit